MTGDERTAPVHGSKRFHQVAATIQSFAGGVPRWKPRSDQPPRPAPASVRGWEELVL